MENKTQLFRPEALASQGSADRLDLVMPVTSPAGWLVLLTLGGLLAGALVWSIAGSVPRKVSGEGVLMRDSEYGLMDITASTLGDIDQILKDEGDAVNADEVVARIDQSELEQELLGLQEVLALTERQHNTQRASENDQLLILREKLANQNQLHERGLVTRSTLLETKSQIYSLESRGFERDEKILHLREEIRQLQNRLARDSVVRSPHPGAVTEVLVDLGDTVREGSRILTLQSLSGDHEVVAFVPATQGKKIKVGMVAEVSPTTVQPEEYGYILGRVREVSSFPVTSDYMKKLIRNDSLVEAMISKGPLIQTVISLDLDSTVSGFRWTSPEGPPFTVEGGSLCNVTIVAEQIRPITLLLPYLKRQFGFY